jgi:hypothetical protein
MHSIRIVLHNTIVRDINKIKKGNNRETLFDEIRRRLRQVYARR